MAIEFEQQFAGPLPGHRAIEATVKRILADRDRAEVTRANKRT